MLLIFIYGRLLILVQQEINKDLLSVKITLYEF